METKKKNNKTLMKKPERPSEKSPYDVLITFPSSLPSSAPSSPTSSPPKKSNNHQSIKNEIVNRLGQISNERHQLRRKIRTTDNQKEREEMMDEMATLSGTLQNIQLTLVKYIKDALGKDEDKELSQLRDDLNVCVNKLDKDDSSLVEEPCKKVYRIDYDESGNFYYEGHMMNGKRHGIGKINVPGVCFYKGDFTNDLPNGSGMMNYYSINSWYIGCIKNSMRHGKGVFVDKTKNWRWEGIFFDDKSMKGKFKNADDTEVYEGHFRNWDYDGLGVLRLSRAQDEYEEFRGTFVKNSMEGIGVMRLKHRDHQETYEGYFKNTQFNGFGKLKTPDGDYTGYFLNNKFHGRGVVTDFIWKYRSMTCFAIHRCNWNNGIKQGKMVSRLFDTDDTDVLEEDQNKMPAVMEIECVYENGEIKGDAKIKQFTIIPAPQKGGKIKRNMTSFYQGEVTETFVYNGKGVLKTDDYIYDGEYKQSFRSGKGIYTLNNGIEITGYFDDNILDDSIDHVIKYPTGQVYTGQIKQTLSKMSKKRYPEDEIIEKVEKHGYGIYTYDGGEVSGVWKDDYICIDPILTRVIENLENYSGEYRLF